MITLRERYERMNASTSLSTKLDVLLECFKQEEDTVLRSQAAYDLAEMYYTGQGLSKDVARAKKMMSAAADLGNGDAMNRYGEMLADENDTECITYFCLALDKANAKAANNLRLLYNAARNNDAAPLCNGIEAGVGEVARIQREDRDDTKGDASVVLALIGVFGLGEKCGISREQGMEYLKASAEKGNPMAIHILQTTAAESAPAAESVKDEKTDKDDFGKSKMEKDSAKDLDDKPAKAAAPTQTSTPAKAAAPVRSNGAAHQSTPPQKLITWKLVLGSFAISILISALLPIPLLITWPVVGFIMYLRKKNR